MQMRPLGSKSMLTGKIKKSNYEHPLNGVLLGVLLIIMGANIYRFLELPHPPFGVFASTVITYFMITIGLLSAAVSLFDWHRIRQNNEQG